MLVSVCPRRIFVFTIGPPFLQVLPHIPPHVAHVSCVGRAFRRRMQATTLVHSLCQAMRGQRATVLGFDMVSDGQ